MPDMSSNGMDNDPMKPVSTLPQPDARQGNYAEVNGARIFYEMTGQGQPMLLLHGYPLSGALFSRVRDSLATRYRVITVDHRGYGKSTAPGVPDDVSIYAKDATALLKQLNISNAIIGGHSMGGAIALGMYKTSPEMFRGLMLIDTTAKAASPIEKGEWNGYAEQTKQMGVPSLVDPLIAVMLTGKTRTTQMDQVDYLGAVIKECSPDAAVGGALALANRPDAMSLLPQIKVPTLVFVGVGDALYPVKMQKMIQGMIPNSKLATIPGGAHAAIFEQPTESSQAIMSWANGI